MRTMLLLPSEIHFINNTVLGAATEAGIGELVRQQVLDNREPPKLQVCEKSGCWFALNSSYLQVFRQLQLDGKCGRVQAEVVPLSKVPLSVQQTMVLSNSHAQAGVELSPTVDGEQDTTRATKKGYNKLAADDDTANKYVGGAETGESDGVSGGSESEEYEEHIDSEEESEYDEDLTCNVCDRAFFSSRQLAQHQMKKRHYGCSACDSLFPSLMSLEHHKEEMDHWTDNEEYEDDDDDDVDDTFDEESEQEEEMERLL